MWSWMLLTNEVFSLTACLAKGERVKTRGTISGPMWTYCVNVPRQVSWRTYLPRGSTSTNLVIVILPTRHTHTDVQAFTSSSSCQAVNSLCEITTIPNIIMSHATSGLAPSIHWPDSYIWPWLLILTRRPIDTHMDGRYEAHYIPDTLSII